MKLSPICQQHDCLRPSAFRYTWPGQEEATICAHHEPRLREVAESMCVPLQIIPLDPPQAPALQGVGT